MRAPRLWRIVIISNDDVVRGWTDLDPLRGADDPKLWIVIAYCMPVERRIKFLCAPVGEQPICNLPKSFAF